MLARKNIKGFITFRSIIFSKKTYFAFTLAQYQNSDQEKKSFLKFSFFEGTPRPFKMK